MPRIKLIYRMWRQERRLRRDFRAQLEALGDDTLIDRLYQDGWLERNWGHLPGAPIGQIATKVDVVRPGTV